MRFTLSFEDFLREIEAPAIPEKGQHFMFTDRVYLVEAVDYVIQAPVSGANAILLARIVVSGSRVVRPSADAGQSRDVASPQPTPTPIEEMDAMAALSQFD